MTNEIMNDRLRFGKEDAPVKVEVFLNAACPYSAAFFDAAADILGDYADNGKVEWIIKHYDKPKAKLLHGTLVNLFLDYSDPTRTKDILKELFKTQKQWKPLNDREIEQLLTDKYGLKEQPGNTDISLEVTAEAVSRNVASVPAFYINSEQIQNPGNMTAEEWRAAVEET